MGFSTKIGITNSFIAEVWCLREGLIIALNQGFYNLVAETNSSSMIQALEREGGSTPEADTLISDCKLLIRQFTQFEIMHVYREGNQCADYLANMGHNSQWETTILTLPPDRIKNILNRDAKNVASRWIY
nr:LINE-type retrotransposon LIb DNA [Ipomoea batatas]